MIQGFETVDIQRLISILVHFADSPAFDIQYSFVPVSHQERHVILSHQLAICKGLAGERVQVQ